MDIKDLAGLSEPLKKLIEVIGKGCGAVSKPFLTRAKGQKGSSPDIIHYIQQATQHHSPFVDLTG